MSPAFFQFRHFFGTLCRIQWYWVTLAHTKILCYRVYSHHPRKPPPKRSPSTPYRGSSWSWSPMPIRILHLLPKESTPPQWRGYPRSQCRQVSSFPGSLMQGTTQITFSAEKMTSFSHNYVINVILIHSFIVIILYNTRQTGQYLFISLFGTLTGDVEHCIYYKFTWKYNCLI